MRILLVEDETSLREGIRDLLGGDGHDVEAFGDGASGLERGLAGPFELAILDVMLPKLSGLDVCRRLRAAHPSLAILMLTARGSEDDKVRGLSDGADDYVTKPFSPRELLARVRALARRTGGAPMLESLHAPGLFIDLARLVVTRGPAAEKTALTPREVGIIRLLVAGGGKPVSRGEILEKVFGQRGDLETRAVDMAIAVLRKKIEPEPGEPTLIVSIKGAGYAWKGA